MLQIMKRYGAGALSSIAAVVVFLVMLPLTLAMILFMLITGVVTMAALRHRLRKDGAKSAWSVTAGANEYKVNQQARNDPIEGSYTVVEK